MCTHVEAHGRAASASGARGAGAQHHAWHYEPSHSMRTPLLGQRSLLRREVRRASVMIFFNAPGCYTSGRSPSACLPAPTDALGPQTRDCLSWCAAAELVRAKHTLILQLDIFFFLFLLAPLSINYARVRLRAVPHLKYASRVTNELFHHTVRAQLANKVHPRLCCLFLTLPNSHQRRALDSRS